jgi:hypothetical protein
MRSRLKSLSWYLLFVCLLLLWTTVAAASKNKSEVDVQDENDYVPGVPFLVEMIGKELYAAVNRPKYKVSYRSMSVPRDRHV